MGKYILTLPLVVALLARSPWITSAQPTQTRDCSLAEAWIGDILNASGSGRDTGLLSHVLAQSVPATASGQPEAFARFIADTLSSELQGRDLWLDAFPSSRPDAGLHDFEVVQRVHQDPDLPLVRIWSLRQIADRPPQFRVTDLQFIETGQTALRLFQVTAPEPIDPAVQKGLKSPTLLWWLLLLAFLFILRKPGIPPVPSSLRKRPSLTIRIALLSVALALALAAVLTLTRQPAQSSPATSLRRALEALRDLQPIEALAALNRIPSETFPEAAVFQSMALLQLSEPAQAKAAIQEIKFPPTRFYQLARLCRNSAPLQAADAFAQLAASLHDNPAFLLAAARMFKENHQQTVASEILQNHHPDPGDPIAVPWMELLLSLGACTPDQTEAMQTTIALEQILQAVMQGTNAGLPPKGSLTSTQPHHPAHLALEVAADTVAVDQLFSPAPPLRPLVHYQLLQSWLASPNRSNTSRSIPLARIFPKHPMAWSLLQPWLTTDHVSPQALREAAQSASPPLSDALLALSDSMEATVDPARDPSCNAGFLLARLAQQPAPWVPETMLGPAVRELLANRLPLTAADAVAALSADRETNQTLHDISQSIIQGVKPQKWPLFQSPPLSPAAEKAIRDAAVLKGWAVPGEPPPCRGLLSAVEIGEQDQDVFVRFLWVTSVHSAKGATLAREWSMPTPPAPGTGQWEQASYLDHATPIPFQRVMQVEAGAYGPQTSAILLPPLDHDRPFVISWVSTFPPSSRTFVSGLWPHPERWPVSSHKLFHQPSRQPTPILHHSILPLTDDSLPESPPDRPTQITTDDPKPHVLWVVGPRLSNKACLEALAQALADGANGIAIRTDSPQTPESTRTHDKLLSFLSQATTLQREHPLASSSPSPRPLNQLVSTMGVSPLERLFLLKAFLTAEGTDATLWVRTILVPPAGDHRPFPDGLLIPDPEGSPPFILHVPSWAPPWINHQLQPIPAPPTEGPGRLWQKLPDGAPPSRCHEPVVFYPQLSFTGCHSIPSTRRPNMSQKRDLVAEFQKNPVPERILALAALAVLLGFLISNLWGSLFRAWFPTLAFTGSLGIVILVGVDLINAKILEEPTRTRVLVGLSLLPGIGFVIDSLQQFWYAVMLAGAIAMSYAGARISLRENLIPPQARKFRPKF